MIQPTMPIAIGGFVVGVIATWACVMFAMWAQERQAPSLPGEAMMFLCFAFGFIGAMLSMAIALGAGAMIIELLVQALR